MRTDYPDWLPKHLADMYTESLEQAKVSAQLFREHYGKFETTLENAGFWWLWINRRKVVSFAKLHSCIYNANMLGADCITNEDFRRQNRVLEYHVSLYIDQKHVINCFGEEVLDELAKDTWHRPPPEIS